MAEVPSVCYETWRDLTITRGQRDRYRGLVWFVSIAFAAACIILIFTVIWGEDPARAVAGLGAIAAGGGLGFVIRERNRADQAYQSAFTLFSNNCGGAKGATATSGAVEGLPDEIIASLSP